MLSKLSILFSPVTLVQFQPRDILDIFIIGILIYAGIQFLRETRSAPIVIGILSLAILYVAAIMFDLPLSQVVLRSFFGFFIIVIAIVFEKELRRFLSSLGFFGLARNFLPPPSETAIDRVVETVTQLKREKIGALIVFAGRESIDHLIEGGEWLRGEISKNLILSIFDTTSPGHDGALIIERDQVERFGVHLPLSENASSTEGYGLRHRAALGLTESSDALVIAVSEEKGTVNVVRGGKMHLVRDAHALKKKLLDFYAYKFPASPWRIFPAWLAKNVFILLFSFIAALLVWSVAASGSRFIVVQRDFVIAPEFTNVSSRFVINDVIPSEVVLRFEARSVDFDSLKPESIRVLIDLENIESAGAHQVAIQPDNVRLPFNVNFSLAKIDPQNLRIILGNNASTTTSDNN